MDNQPTNSVNRRLFILIVTAIILLAVGAVGWIFYRAHNYPAKITIEVTPKSSSVTLNGEKSHAGTIFVTPGEMNVSVSKDGFDTQSKKITVKEGETGYVGIALTSNSPATADWYKNHLDDQTLLEKITGNNYTKEADSATQQVPLISKLPYIGAGYEYRIDYGAPPAGQATKDKTAIYITYYTPDGRQAALDWIKQEGYDPAKLTIIFSDKPMSTDTGD